MTEPLSAVTPRRVASSRVFDVRKFFFNVAHRGPRELFEIPFKLYGPHLVTGLARTGTDQATLYLEHPEGVEMPQDGKPDQEIRVIVVRDGQVIDEGEHLASARFEEGTAHFYVRSRHSRAIVSDEPAKPASEPAE